MSKVCKHKDVSDATCELKPGTPWNGRCDGDCPLNEKEE